MREGQRDGEDDSPETDQADDESAASEAAATASEATPKTDAGEATAEDPATASTDGGAAATTAEPETTEGDDGGSANDGSKDDSSDGSVDDVVESVSGTRAELPSTEQMEAAMEQTMEQAEPATDAADETDASAADAATEAPTADEETEASTTEEPAGPAAGIAGDAEETKEADTRILEFTLDDEQYCLDIQYIEEIVKHTAITRVPNTPEFVEGVVDLRGQITTILNPKVTIDKPNKEAGDLIVVFDSEAFEDQGHIGWVVDDVRQVSPISEDQVNDPPMQEDYINGVIDRDDGEFVIWTTPDLALEEAE
jgi:purine-binding chemotaxis protein CheW